MQKEMDKKIETRSILNLNDVIDHWMDEKKKSLILDFGEKGQLEIVDEAAIASISDRLKARKVQKVNRL